jgi:hypothetical protein
MGILRRVPYNTDWRMRVESSSEPHRRAAQAAARYAQVNGIRPTIAVLQKFGVERIAQLALEDLPAFEAACWVGGPKIRRVK